MKKIAIVTVTMLATLLGACSNLSSTKDESKSGSANQQFDLDTTKLKSGDSFYHCEMHPEVISDKIGNCPKCGMELVMVKKN